MVRKLLQTQLIDEEDDLAYEQVSAAFDWLLCLYAPVLSCVVLTSLKCAV